jgi:GT2 family glycosyltransferase
MHIATIITCHNRRLTTLSCLEALFLCRLPEDLRLEVFLVDDGSTDGTSQSVIKRFPMVKIITGDSNLFWCRGMSLSWQMALTSMPDYVLWLNDDTILYSHAMTLLLKTAAQQRDETGKRGIVVGSTDNDAGQLSYGGAIPISAFNRLKTRKVEPCDGPQSAVTMNGNCVLVHRDVYERIGILDKVFQHGMGDIDYGFRAHKAGVPIWVMPGFAGRCNNDHEFRGSFRDSELTLLERWRKITSPKGLPLVAWFVLCQRHAGPLWPLVWLLPYAKVLLGIRFNSHSRFKK